MHKFGFESGIGLEEVDVDKAEEALSVWSQFLHSIGNYGSWRKDPRIRISLHNKLSYFGSGHKGNTKHIETVMYSVSKGYSLIRETKKWESPYVGEKPNSSQSTSRLRGLQWRLVMAYNAFEIVCFALRNHQRGGLQHSMLTDFVSKCELGTFNEIITPPNKNRAALKKWLEAKPGTDEGDLLIEFLGHGREDAAALREWLIDEQPIGDWDKAVMLAKALRNASAHGALSASKIKDFGFREAVEVLPDCLCEVINGAIRKLL